MPAIDRQHQLERMREVIALADASPTPEEIAAAERVLQSAPATAAASPRQQELTLKVKDRTRLAS